MAKKWLFSALALVLLSLVVFRFLLPGPVSPQEQAVASWFQSLKDAGATTARYDALKFDEASDTVTIENPQIDWRLDFSIENIPPYDISFSTSQIVITGLKQEAEGFSAKQYSVPDDALLKISGNDKKGDTFSLTGTIKGLKAEEVFYPRITAVPEDPKRPVSRYLHYYDLFLKTMVKKFNIDQVLIIQTVNGEEGFRSEYNGLSVQDLQTGQFEEMRMASYKQTMRLAKKTDDIPFDKMETSYGEMIQRGVDLRPIIDALKGEGKGPETDYRTIVAETSLSDMDIVVGPVNLSMENYRIDGIKVRPGKRSLLAMLDRLALGEAIDDKETFAISLDFIRGFAMDKLSISNFQGSGPQNVTASMAEFIIKNLSNQGLEKITVEDIDVNGNDGEKLSLANATIGDVAFPSIENIVAAFEQGSPGNPFSAAALAPRIGKIEVSNLLIDDKMNPALSLGLFRLLQSGFIGAIPTDIKIATKNLKFPVAFIEDARAQLILQSLGYKVLKIAARFALKWDEASEDLTLENADISLDNGVKITLKAGLAGLPRSVIEGPRNIMQAMATLAFKNLNFLAEDAVLVSGLVDYFAKTQNKTPEEIRASIIQLIELQAGPLSGTPFMETVKTALRSFLENPEKLAVDANPKAPVPFIEVLAIGSMSPDQVPELLGAKVSANDNVN